MQAMQLLELHKEQGWLMLLLRFRVGMRLA
jgi:hypothetical protein